MLHHSKLQIFQRRWKIVVLFVVICAALSAALYVVLPFHKEYRADAQVLLIPDSRYGVDPYTAVRLAEQVGQNLAQIVETSDFSRKALMRIENRIDVTRYTAASELERRKHWKEDVEATVEFGTGIVTVSAYHAQPDAAVLLNQTVLATLLSDAPEYIGSSVVLKIVNPPIATEYPVRPNIMVVTMIGALIGAFLAFLLLVK